MPAVDWQLAGDNGGVDMLLNAPNLPCYALKIACSSISSSLLRVSVNPAERDQQFERLRQDIEKMAQRKFFLLSAEHRQAAQEITLTSRDSSLLLKRDHRR